jgi:hypothetical protein
MAEHPRHVGGGWYVLSSGDRVQGKEAAEKAEASLGGGRSSSTRTRGNDEQRRSEPLPGEEELILVAASEATLRVEEEGMASLAGMDVSSLNDMLASEGVTVRPLFGINEERLHDEASALAAATDMEVPDLSRFYRVEAPQGRLAQLAEELAELEVVDAAYVKPPSEPAQEDLNTMLPSSEEAPPATPDFTSRQGYLQAAPVGVDAVWARGRPGGGGAGVRVIDIEGAWRFTHEDLVTNQGGVVGGTQSTDLGWRNHGTAVVGEIGADVNGFGVTGISPDAFQMAISIFGGMGSSAAIRAAANRLRPGDIILIELHRAGPRHSFQARSDQAGYIALEWWEDDFAAIRYAVSRGVLVVEAAGNGAENLDDALYNTPGPGFPSSWTNPFNRSNRDSGAIVVGAGAPPPGTHGRNHGPDRSRLGFSNFGSLIDAQGWGREVTTTGYGDLQGGTNEDLWYTDRFSGTSSASPIVVGALASLQGMLRASGRTPLTPAKARSCLRSTGSPQQDAPDRPRTQRIGNRPDLPELWKCAVGVKLLKESKELYKERPKEVKEVIKEGKELKERSKELKEIKERLKETKERKEFKEVKERAKELKEPKEIMENKISEVLDPTGEAGGDVGARLSNLESVVAELTHFIAGDLRPDLGSGALSYEDDYGTLGPELESASRQAKDAKDAKDVEKLSEG